MARGFEPQPVHSEEDAIAWLFKHTRPEEWLYASADTELPQAAMLVCDMFWLRPSDLVRRMRRMYETALRDPAPLGWRHRRFQHWGR